MDSLFACVELAYYIIILFFTKETHFADSSGAFISGKVCVSAPATTMDVSRSFILDFHGVLTQSFCEGQEAEEGREQMGPSCASGHFQDKDIPFADI